jgi:hypothetical protein
LADCFIEVNNWGLPSVHFANGTILTAPPLFPANTMFHVHGTLTMAGNMNLNQYTFLMHSNARVVIPSGFSLTLNNSGCLPNFVAWPERVSLQDGR